MCFQRSKAGITKRNRGSSTACLRTLNGWCSVRCTTVLRRFFKIVGRMVALLDRMQGMAICSESYWKTTRRNATSFKVSHDRSRPKHILMATSERHTAVSRDELQSTHVLPFITAFYPYLTFCPAARQSRRVALLSVPPKCVVFFITLFVFDKGRYICSLRDSDLRQASSFRSQILWIMTSSIWIRTENLIRGFRVAELFWANVNRFRDHRC